MVPGQAFNKSPPQHNRQSAASIQPFDSEVSVFAQTALAVAAGNINSQGANLVQTKLAVIDGGFVNSI